MRPAREEAAPASASAASASARGAGPRPTPRAAGAAPSAGCRKTGTPCTEDDSIVAGAVQSDGRSAVDKRIVLIRPLLSVSIRCRLEVGDMNVGND